MWTIDGGQGQPSNIDFEKIIVRHAAISIGPNKL